MQLSQNIHNTAHIYAFDYLEIRLCIKVMHSEMSLRMIPNRDTDLHPDCYMTYSRNWRLDRETDSKREGF